MVKHTSKQLRHRIIKTHRSHKWVIAAIYILLLVIGILLYFKVKDVDQIADDNYKVLVVGLLFSLNVAIIILIVLVASFYIEVKDELIEV